MVYVNSTGYEFVDAGRDIIINTLGGDVVAGFLILSGIFILCFLMMGARKEAVLLVPLPALVTVADSIGILWLKVIMWMIAGVYLAGMIFVLANIGDK